MVTELLNRLIGISKQVTRQEESFDSQKLKDIIISTDIVSVEVLVHEQPIVEVTLTSYEDGPVLQTEMTENALVITAKKERKGPHFVFGNLPKCHLQILVPEDIADNWDITTSSGGIAASQLTANVFRASATSGKLTLANMTAGKVMADTTSGKIKIEEIKTDKLTFHAGSGKVEVTSSYGDIVGKVGSGNVSLSGAKGEELEVKAGSGKIILNEVYMKNATLRANSGKITSEYFWSESTNVSVGSGIIDMQGMRGSVSGGANSGNISLSLVENADLDLKTGSGKITLIFQQEELNAQFDIKTGSGDIVTDIPMLVEQNNRHHITGKVGTGENHIRLRAGSGNIVMNKA